MATKANERRSSDFKYVTPGNISLEYTIKVNLIGMYWKVDIAMLQINIERKIS